MVNKEILKTSKALANEARLEILELLKNPLDNFPPNSHIPKDAEFDHSVCVQAIGEVLAMSQSTISNYLTQLAEVGLLESKRFGQWVYYRRNEAGIKAFASEVLNNL